MAETRVFTYQDIVEDLRGRDADVVVLILRGGD